MASKPGAGRAARVQSSPRNRYPTPDSVRRCLGRAGSASILIAVLREAGIPVYVEGSQLPTRNDPAVDERGLEAAK